jgi:hypothetical protein
MIFNFNMFIKKEKRRMITIPSELCKKYNVKLKDVIFVKIKNYEFFGYVVGTNSSKRVTLPLKILKKLPPKDTEIKVTILPKRKSGLKIVNNKIDLYYSLPDMCKHLEWPLAVVVKDKKLLVWSPSAYDQVIPRYLKLDINLFEVFGLYQGEGYKKAPISGTRLEFVNCDKEIINIVLNFFKEKFNIPLKRWSAYINYVHNKNNIKSHNQLVSHWSNETKIPKDNFRKTQYLKGEGIKSASFGTLHILIPSCVLGEICLGILDHLEILSTKNEKHAAAFLRGLMAADGSAIEHQYKHNKTLRNVDLAIETQKEIILYKKIINKLNIEVKDYSTHSRKLCICGWDNFYKLAKIDIFKLHRKKANSFKNGFSNHKYTLMIKKYLSPLLKEELSVKELAKKLKLSSKGSLLLTLKLQMNKGLIKRIKKRKEDYKYFLTKGGYSILKFLEGF